MSVDDQVRPLHLRVPESELDDLRERLRRTRLPEAETVTGPDGRASTGVRDPLAAPRPASTGRTSHRAETARWSRFPLR